MKRISVLFCISTLLLALVGCNLKEKRAKQYRDDVLQSVQAVIDSSLGFGDGIQSYRKSQALGAHASFSALVNRHITRVEELKDFEGDTTLEVYSKELLNFYKSKLDKEIGPFVQSVKEEAFTPEETAAADSIMDIFMEKQAAHWDRFNWAEKEVLHGGEYRESGEVEGNTGANH